MLRRSNLHSTKERGIFAPCLTPLLPALGMRYVFYICFNERSLS